MKEKSQNQRQMYKNINKYVISMRNKCNSLENN